MLNILKLALYLIFFLHCIACYFWATITMNAPVRFFIDVENNRYVREPTVEEQLDWHQKGFSDEVTMGLLTYKDEAGDILKADLDMEVVWGEKKFFGDIYWPVGENGQREGLTSENQSEFDWWSGNPIHWYAPLDFINFPDARLFSTEYNLKKQYFTMFYYAVLVMG
mmetsp:Transcript_12709/g.19724  ORF Transcript_12709/g.19724 Transcript_12709/m.19724 type:complete len:167 (+) Transcript_12709:2-502(+)